MILISYNIFIEISRRAQRTPEVQTDCLQSQSLILCCRNLTNNNSHSLQLMNNRLKCTLRNNNNNHYDKNINIVYLFATFPSDLINGEMSI